jgi:hypothetical protein
LSFYVAIDQDPVYLDNKTWQWSYSSSVFTITYKVRLTGQIRADDVLWKMYITREGAGGFSEFLWFEGTSDNDGKGGQWTLNHSSQFQEPVLKIDWEGDGTDVTMIKYTYIRTLDNARNPDSYKNSYIEYGHKTGSFDSYYDVYLWYNAAFTSINVEWSSTGLNGRVSCLPFFGDTADPTWHCWDGNYVNVTCP